MTLELSEELPNFSLGPGLVATTGTVARAIHGSGRVTTAVECTPLDWVSGFAPLVGRTNVRRAAWRFGCRLRSTTVVLYEPVANGYARSVAVRAIVDAVQANVSNR